MQPIRSAKPKNSVIIGWISIITKKHTAKINISIAKSNVKITKYCCMLIFDLINFGNKNINPSTTAPITAPAPKLTKMVERTFGKLKVLIKVKDKSEQEIKSKTTKSIFARVVGNIVLNFSTNFIIFIWHLPMIKYRIKTSTTLLLN